MKHKIYGFIVGLVLCPLIVYAGLEVGTYISDLVVTNPTGSDNASTADDHMRLIKSTIKNTFPNITGAVTATHTQLNYVTGVTSSIQTQLNALPAASSGSFTGTLTGMTGATTLTVNWVKIGSIVTMYGPSGVAGTSNAATMTMTGIPAGLFPAHQKEVYINSLENNGAVPTAGSVEIDTSAAFRFGIFVVSGSFIVSSLSSFTSSGLKGLNSGWSFTYDVT